MDRTWQYDMRNLTLDRKNEILNAQTYLIRKRNKAFMLYLTVCFWIVLGLAIWGATR